MKANGVDNLMNISTYPFENCLRLLGLNLKHGYLPLEQVAKRVIEKSQLGGINSFHRAKSTPYVFKPDRANSEVFEKVQICPDVRLNSKKFGDSWFFTKTNQIVKMISAKMDNNRIQIVGSVVKEYHDAFTLPIHSSRLNIFASNAETDDSISTFDLDSIISKIMCLPYKNEYIFIPILHTMDSLSLKN